ncbi:hypothetical protein DE146DRAFT_749377 [Phaeosphaeria sp. MPI-PUGE-AT-0046c]|nr:hypothetical protein DE146DRAFT_749377 [Phaeosphaeria sp. MPI-PUGE-AT-0046c]
MMAPSALFSGQPTVVPSNEQIALAITIVRSKPVDVSMRDYVQILREHCRPGQPPSEAEEHGHYLDLAGYWQDQCQRAQDECSRLRSTNVRLERSNHQLSQQVKIDPQERRGTASGFSKRKAAASPTRSPKRPKPSVEQTIAETQEGIEHDFVFLDGLGSDGAALVETLYSTHQLCRATDRDAEVLCRHLVQTCSALSKVIRVIAHNHEHLTRRGRGNPSAMSLDEDRSDFAQALTISARAFMSVLVGISKMMDASSDSRLPNLVVCELAETFKSVLQAITSAAHDSANASPSSSAVSNKKNSKDAVSVVKESVPGRSLAHFLIGILGLLDKSNDIHQKIFDAFAFLLLERVGKQLHYCTFGRNRGDSMEDELSPKPKPSGPSLEPMPETGTLALRLELKALVLILDRAMGLAPHHMNPTSSKAARQSTANRVGRTLSMKTLPAAPKGRLSSLAKDRLQRTLVSCMFGDDTDDEFLDILTKPMPSMRVSNLASLARVEDENVERWFKEEVWRLVGWDIMAKEAGW